MIIAVILIPVILIASAVLSLNALKKAEAERFLRFRNKKDNKTAEEMYHFMFKLLKAEGITHGLHGEPPTEFAVRADKSLGKENISLSEIMPVFEKLEFSHFDLEPEEYDSLSSYIDALYDETVTKQNRFKRLSRRLKFNK